MISVLRRVVYTRRGRTAVSKLLSFHNLTCWHKTC